ncbi:MAG TPA: class A beta-lactamase, subclass A2 [Bacteroidota bacterium]|nr:class A beta-lactamase, subclass A2 [Bacteroidota bacterium]
MFKNILVLCVMCSSAASAQIDLLRNQVQQIVTQANGTIGVAFENIETGDTLSVGGDGRYPMQSVYKFPLALAVLKRVDEGTLSLNQNIFITKKDLRLKTWSPMREKYPKSDTALSLHEILSFTVSQSDNNGCDVLFRLLGGTNVVHQFVHGLGVTDIAIAATEEEMAHEWNVQFRNWCTPLAMRKLIRMFYDGKILSDTSTSYLLRLLEETTTSPGRLRGLLPLHAIVAHKTGSSGENAHGVAAATNDAGIITLPNGQHAILVVFMTNSTANENVRDNVIARIAKSVWKKYEGKR